MLHTAAQRESGEDHFYWPTYAMGVYRALKRLSLLVALVLTLITEQR